MGPEEAAKAAVDPGAAEGTAGAMGEAAEQSFRPTDLLLSTRPDESPAEYHGMSDGAADILIGIKKSLNAVSPDRMESGTPAVFNYLRGSYRLIKARQSEDNGGGETFDREAPR